MKRKIDFLIVALFAVVLFASCERVAPNYASPFFFSLQVESSTLHTLHDGRYYKESFCSYKMPLL